MTIGTGDLIIIIMSIAVIVIGAIAFLVGLIRNNKNIKFEGGTLIVVGFLIIMVYAMSYKERRMKGEIDGKTSGYQAEANAEADTDG